MQAKGVIVAAGYGSRFLPITRTLPKEMLPIVDRPCLDLVVQEFIDAGIREILVITSRRKKVLDDWFDRSPELEQAFADAPHKLAKAHPPDVDVQFVRQKRMTGTGDALLLAESFAGDQPVVVAFPDDLFMGPNPTAELLETHRATGGSVLAVADLSGQDVSRYGVLDATPEGPWYRVNNLVEKPAPGTEPSSLVSLGRFLYTPDFFKALRDHRPTTFEGEYFTQDAFRDRATAGRLFAHAVKADRFDTGRPLGYLKAIVSFAEADPEIGDAFKAWLAERA